MKDGEADLRGNREVGFGFCYMGEIGRSWVVLRELWTFDASRHGVRSYLRERGGVWFDERF